MPPTSALRETKWSRILAAPLTRLCCTGNRDSWTRGARRIAVHDGDCHVGNRVPGAKPLIKINCVSGINGGTTGIAVYGRAEGSGAGVYGTSNGKTGVQGVGSSAAADVEGDNSSTGAGVYGSNTGTGVGVAGFGGGATSSAPVSSSVVGVWGVAPGGAAGVEGNNSSGGPGVYGVSLGGGTGVLGSSTGGGAAILGANSSSGAGVYGTSSSGIGVWGVTTTSGEELANPAVAGTNNGGGAAPVGFTAGPSSIGLGGATDVGICAYGSSQTGDGLYGYSNTGVAIHGVSPGGGYAGFFNGPVFVTGSLTAMSAKSAAVKTKSGLRRVYSVESPESWFEDFGSGQLTEGRATVKLEPGFASIVHTDTYHGFLTASGDSQGLYVSERHRSGFTGRERQEQRRL
jgi:hypothetical protein